MKDAIYGWALGSSTGSRLFLRADNANFFNNDGGIFHISMKSCIYEGSIRHRRFYPVDNRFQYRVFFMFLDLAELPDLFSDHPLWSAGQVNLAYFRRRDHMGDPRKPLDQAMSDHIESILGVRARGPIRLLCHLRYFGHCFNPVSFYYCYDPADTRLETIVAEIHNTPWGEEHLYVLGREQNRHPLAQWRRFVFNKAFHVSPFMDMDIRYDWRFRVPGERLNVHMTNYWNDRKLFDATLALRRRSISRRRLTRVLLQYPVMTMKVVFFIYWQALRLTVKKAPFYPHPKKRTHTDQKEWT